MGLWESLQDRISQTTETVTRSARIDIAGSDVDEIDPPEDIDEFAEQARQTAIVRANMRQFVNDVWGDGYRVEGPDETVQYFEGDVEDIDAEPPEITPENGFLDNCFVYAGEKRQDWYEGAKETTYQRWIRGTILIEYLKADLDDAESEITGFYHIRPETVYPQVHNNKNILLSPDETDLDGAVTTRRDEAAAYIQFDDESILGLRGAYDGKQEVPLSQNDVLKFTLDAGIGDDFGSETQGVFGTSIMEAISDDVSEYNQTKRDRFNASQRKAYGLWTAQFKPEVIEGEDFTEIIEWTDDQIQATENELNAMEPKDVLTSDANIDLERHDAELADLDPMLQRYVEDIVAALPAPLYMTGHAGDINRDVTSEQSKPYDDLVSEERLLTETKWSQAFKFVAERAGLPTEGLQVKLQPPKEDNPVKSLSSDEIDRMNTYINTLAVAAGPQAGPTALVDSEDILEVLDFPVEETDPEDIVDEVATEETEAAWADIMGLESLDWNPELHPRDGEGKFTESPFSGVIDRISEFALDIEIDEVGGGEFPDLQEIQFKPDVPAEKRFTSALGYDPETNTYEEGIVRYGDISFDEAPDWADKSVAEEDLNDIIDMIGRPSGDYKVDMGHFQAAAPHIRVNGDVSADEFNEFMDDLTGAINEWFYPYEPEGAPQESEELQAVIESLSLLQRREPESLQGRYEPGTWVDTPDGEAMVDDRVTEGTVDGMDASSDSPVYAVAMLNEAQVNFYRASDLTETDEPTVEDIEDPVGDVEAMVNIEHAIEGEAEALQFGDFDYPESWKESSTPNRVILMDAWSSMGGQFDCGGACCMGELKSERLCASMKDAALGTHAWRGGWAD